VISLPKKTPKGSPNTGFCLFMVNSTKNTPGGIQERSPDVDLNKRLVLEVPIGEVLAMSLSSETVRDQLVDIAWNEAITQKLIEPDSDDYYLMKGVHK